MKNKTLKQLIKACKFDYISPAITDANLPDDGRRGTVELKNFDKYLTSEQIIKALRQDGCRPATAHELFQYLATHEEKDKWIVALGSVFSFGGEQFVVHVWWSRSKREAGRGWFGGGWSGSGWFAFVRESKLGNSETRDLATLESRISEVEKFKEKVEKILKL